MTILRRIAIVLIALAFTMALALALTVAGTLSAVLGHRWGRQ